MNRVIIPTSDPTYGDVYFNKDAVASVTRDNNNSVTIRYNFQNTGIIFDLAVTETGSTATYDAFIEAIYAANPGGDTKVILPKGQSIPTVRF
jgi:ABC-type branched-subunit amino acid transport system ATPase component